jgi:hypothetical protein
MAKKANKVTNTDTAIIGAGESQAEKKTRGGNLSAHYIDGNGNESVRMPEDVQGTIIRVGANEDGKSFGALGEERVMLRDLPTPMQYALAAFGLRTLQQNSVNTAESVYEGWEALQRRTQNLRDGKWADVGAGGGGVPLYLQAFKRAAEKAGWTAETVAEKYDAMLAIYNSEEGGEKEVEKRRKDLRKQLLSKPSIEAAMLELQDEAIAKRRAALASKAPASGDDLAGL